MSQKIFKQVNEKASYQNNPHEKLIGESITHIKELNAIEYNTKDNITATFKERNGYISFEVPYSNTKALHLAATRGDSVTIEQLISVNSNVNERDSHGWTPAFYATYAGHIETLALLKNHGGQMGIEDIHGRSLLIIAAHEGHGAVVEFLVQLDEVDIMHVTKTGKAALHYSCLKGHVEMAQILVDKRRELLDHRDHKGRTAIMDCALLDNLAMMQCLQFLGARLDIVDDTGDTPLILAAKAGSQRPIDFLIGHSTNIDHQNKAGHTALMEAIRYEHPEITKLLHGKGSSLDLTSMAGISAMQMACGSRNGQISIYFEQVYAKEQTVKFWFRLVETRNLVEVKSGDVDVHAKNKNGYTLLMAACLNGSVDITEYLCQKGCNVNVQAADGMTACASALLSHDPEAVIRILLEYRADINLRGINGQTMLHKAAEGNEQGNLKTLHTLRADIELPDNQGRTPLIVACEKGHGKIVKDLLSAGAKTTTKDNQGKTALAHASGEVQSVLLGAMGIRLIEAVLKSDSQQVNALIAADAPVDYQDQTKNNTTALIEGCNSCNLQIVYALCEATANPNISDNKGRTPLTCTCHKGNIEIAELLIAKGALVNAKESDSGTTALHYTSFHGHVETLRLLLKHKANMEATNKKYCTPLTYACYGRHFNIAKELCNAGANVNHQDSSGYTPLMAAARVGEMAIIQLLVRNKADLNITLPTGYRAVDVAWKFRNGDIANWLGREMARLDKIKKADRNMTLRSIGGVTLPSDSIPTWDQQPSDPVPTWDQQPSHMITTGDQQPSDSIPTGDEQPSDPDQQASYLIPPGDHCYSEPQVSQQDWQEKVMQVLRDKEGCTLYRVKQLLHRNRLENFSGGNSPMALHLCAQMESRDAPQIVELLVEKCGFDIDEQDSNGHTPFFECCVTGNISVGEKLIELGADVSIESTSGMTALEEACSRNFPALVKYILCESVKRDILDKCLAHALAHKFVKIVKLITKACNLQPKEGMPSLSDAFQISTLQRPMLASSNMSPDSWKLAWIPLLVDEGCLEAAKVICGLDKNISCVHEPIINVSEYQKCADNALEEFGTLAKFILNGAETFRREICSLIENGEDIDQHTGSGMGILHVAVIKQDITAIRWLLRFGADIDIMDRQKVTPLHLAQKFESKHIVRFLLRQGANTQGCTFSEETTTAKLIKKYEEKRHFCNQDDLFKACREGPIDEAVKSQSILNFARDARGNTLLHVAVKENHEETVKFLLENKTNPSKFNGEGQTPLMIASEEGHVEICKLLLSCGAEPCIRDKKGGLSALQFAVDGCHIEAMRCLLDNSANPNQEDFCKRISLHRACVKDNVEVLQILIRHQAEVNHQDKYGYTPIMIAVEKRSFGVIASLLQQGADVTLKNCNGETAVDLTNEEVIKTWLREWEQQARYAGCLRLNES